MVKNCSNHLKEMKPEHFTIWTLLCLVFKWSDHVVRWNIRIPDISGHKEDIFSGFQTTIWKPDHLTSIGIPELSSI